MGRQKKFINEQIAKEGAEKWINSSDRILSQILKKMIKKYKIN